MEPKSKVIKRREKGKKPNKKWMDKDVMKILNFIERQKQFEKPTAKQYYNKLLSTTGIEATWEILNYKVRYLRRCFLKAEAWKHSEEGRLLENTEGFSSVIERIKRTCPFYDRLHGIFGHMIPERDKPGVDTEMSSPDNASSSSKDCKESVLKKDKCKLEFVESKAESRGNKGKPNKKWMDDEVYEIIDYIERNKQFEKPTCKVYYSSFLKNSRMNVTWDLVKWKVRNLKTSFFKAEAWRISNEAKLFETDEGTEKFNMRLQGMCPFYNRLKNIFGINSNFTSDSVEEEEDLLLQNKLLREDSLEKINDIFDTNSNYESDFVESEVDLSVQNEPYKEYSDPFSVQPSLDNNNFPSTVKKESISELVCIEKEKTLVEKMRIDLDREKFLKEMELRQQEIDLKKHELELKKLEIEKSERIRVLEIEKDERLARLEIQLKYRNYEREKKYK